MARKKSSQPQKEVGGSDRQIFGSRCYRIPTKLAPGSSASSWVKSLQVHDLALARWMLPKTLEI